MVLLKREGFDGRQAAGGAPPENKWLVQVQVIPRAARDKGHTGALYSKNSDWAAEAGAGWGGAFYYGVRSLRRFAVERQAPMTHFT